MSRSWLCTNGSLVVAGCMFFLACEHSSAVGARPAAGAEVGDDADVGDASAADVAIPADAATDSVPAAGYLWPGEARLIMLATTGDWAEGQTRPPSSCSPGGEGVYLLRQDQLSWSVCQPRKTDRVYEVVRGSKTLSPDELESIHGPLRALRLSQQTGCGADASDTELLVDTPDGVFRYHDSFYACHRKGTYVDGLWEVGGAMFAIERRARP